MSTYKKKPNFMDTEEGALVEQILKAMVFDTAFNTQSSYSTNSELYPNNKIPFVNRHMEYLRSHPDTNPQHYISNLRLMTRIKK